MVSAPLITVISGCTKVYQPAPHPTARHILLAGGKIQGFPDDAQAAALAATGLATTLDASGLVAVPGFVDVSAGTREAVGCKRACVHQHAGAWRPLRCAHFCVCRWHLGAAPLPERAAGSLVSQESPAQAPTGHCCRCMCT